MRLLALRNECQRLADNGATLMEIITALDVHPQTAAEAIARTMQRHRRAREQSTREEIKRHLEGNL